MKFFVEMIAGTIAGMVAGTGERQSETDAPENHFLRIASHMEAWYNENERIFLFYFRWWAAVKQRFFSLLVCTALLLSIVCSAHTAWADSSSDDGGTYTDPETGATFLVPKGWEEDEFNREGAASVFQAKFISLNDPGSALLYGSYDLWDELTASERSGLTRSEIDSAYLYADKEFLKSFADLASQKGFQTSDDAIQLVTYGKNECVELSAVQNIFGFSVPITMTWYIENGCAYIFMVSATGDQVGKDFQSVLYSLQIPETDTQSKQNTSSPTLSELLANAGLHPLTALLNLLLTFSFYTLPILIYRFALHSGPLEKKHARKIAIIYGICAYLLMCLITALLNGHAGAAILFWSYVNYYILISGKKPEPDPADTLTEHTDRLPSAAQLPASQMPPAAPAVPASPTPAAYIPAASMPAAPAPQTSSSPAAYTPASPVQQTTTPAPQTPPAPRIQFCKNCGFRLLEDSKFCSACGTPVVPVTKE